MLQTSLKLKRNPMDVNQIKETTKQLTSALDGFVKNIESTIENNYKNMGSEHHLNFINAMKSANINEAIDKIKRGREDFEKTLNELKNIK